MVPAEPYAMSCRSSRERLQNGASGGITEMINGFLAIVIVLKLLYYNNFTAIIPNVKFGNTPGFWLNAQRAVELWNAERENKQEIEKITPIKNLFLKFMIYILALSNKLVIIILF